MTLKDLLQGVNAEEQLRILALADHLFPLHQGRYYGGSLTADEIEIFKKPAKGGPR